MAPVSINPGPGALSCPPSLHSGLGSAWLVLLRAHPLGQAATTQRGPQSDCGHWTSTLTQMGTALRPHRKGTGLWGQDTGWVRQQNPDRRSEHISTSPPHGWGCLPQTLSLTWWCHYQQLIKKGTGFPIKERGEKKNRSLKCLAAAEAGEALKRARCLVPPMVGERAVGVTQTHPEPLIFSREMLKVVLLLSMALSRREWDYTHISPPSAFCYSLWLISCRCWWNPWHHKASEVFC